MSDRSTPGSGVSLRELLPEAEIVGADDIRITSCCADSRYCRPGDLFVALPGARDDGHDFVLAAANSGAAAVLADRPTAGCRLPTCYVKDTRMAYGRVCQTLAGSPARRLKAIGVTGTNGKTTSTYLIASVLQAAGFRSGILGTLGYSDGFETLPANWTTPPAPVLANWLARMVNNGCTHAVMEVSSHALSQARIAGVELDVACITNVRHDHLDYHQTIDNYRATKAKLFDYLLPEGFAVLNVDCDVCNSCLSKLDGPVLTVGLDSAAEVSATLVEQYLSEQTFLLHSGDETVPVRTHLIGRHNVANCLTAAAVGLTYGIDLTTIVRGLEAVESLPGRLERIECGQPFGVFVDFAHTPDALTGCLNTLREVTPGRLICVFGAGGDRDQTKRPHMGRAVAEAADIAVVTSDNPRHEDPQKIMAGIMQGMRQHPTTHVIGDRGQAIHWALGEAKPGDCVLIAGKGHESYQQIGDEQHEFDDRQVAREWLYTSPSLDEMYRASA